MPPFPLTLDELVDRIGAGQTIDPDSLPEALRALPEVQRLLAFARVAQGLSHATPPAAENQQLGPWVCVRALGSGGMGDVWLGERRDGVVTQQVAIKRLRVDTERFRARLRAERQILARLEHPGIARFIDAGVDERGAPWMAIEYVPGVTLTQWARGRSLRERLTLFQRICAAVAYAHRHLIVHRDLKPANVLVNDEGEPKLLDFGIAKLLDDTQRESTLASMTPAYAAPEQLRGEPISTATDVYALGLMLFELLAGRLPDSRTGSAMALAVSVDAEETQRVSQAASSELPYLGQVLSGDLDAIVAGALRAEPQRRYPSATALSEDIDRFLRNEPVQARRPTRRYLFAKFLSRNRYAAAFAAIAGVSLIAASVVSFYQAERAREAAALALAEAKRAEAQAQRATRVREFLVSVFGEGDGMARAGASAQSPLQLVRKGIAGLDSEFGEDAEGKDNVLGDLLNIQVGLGDAKAALPAVKQLVADRRTRYPVGDTRIADALAAQILALFQLGQFVDAEPAITEALEIYRAHRGEQDVSVADMLNRLARVRFAQTRYQESLDLMRQVIAILTQVRGPDDALTGHRLSTMGNVLMRMGKLDEARAAFQDSIRIISAALGDEHASLMFPLNALGDLQRNAGDDTSAMMNYQRSLEILEAAVGRDHPNYATTLNRIGDMHRRRGDYLAARTTLEDARAIQERGGFAELGDTLGRLGDIATDVGDSQSALDFYRKAYDFQRSAHGERNLSTVLRLGNVGNALSSLERFDEAREVRRDAIAQLQALGDGARLQVAIAEFQLGITEMQAGNTGGAIEYLRRGADGIGALAPSTDARTRLSQLYLALALALRNAPGDAEQAVDLLRRSGDKPGGRDGLIHALASAALGIDREQSLADFDANAAVAGPYKAWLTKLRRTFSTP